MDYGNVSEHIAELFTNAQNDTQSFKQQQQQLQQQ